MRFSDHHIIYNQTWEDPFVDAEGLQITKKDVVVCVISGGCNVLNLSLENLNHIYAVDQSYAQYALLHLKLASVKILSYPKFWNMFGSAKSQINFTSYVKCIRSGLLDPEKAYWDRHIYLFSSGFYGVGRLGFLYVLKQWIVRSCGEGFIRKFASSKNLQVQQKLYFTSIKPRLWTRINRSIPVISMVLYGVHPRQIFRCIWSRQFLLQDVFLQRLDTLFTNIFIKNNYFWHRILLGKYKSRILCPPYLQKRNFLKLKHSINKISWHNDSIVEFLQTLTDSHVTKFNLSDIPEFLCTNAQYRLWTEVRRTGKNNARVLYRSFSPDFFIPTPFLETFVYLKEVSELLTQKEMTGSYAAVYVYQIRK